MVFAVRCPAAACRKYMLVEDADRGQTVACLICKAAIKVPAPAGAAPASQAIPAPVALEPTPAPFAPYVPPPKAVPQPPSVNAIPSPVALMDEFASHITEPAIELEIDDEPMNLAPPDKTMVLEPPPPKPPVAKPAVPVAKPLPPPGVPVARRLPPK